MREELPDLTIRSLQLENNAPLIGSEIKIEATVYNLGTKEASQVKIRFLYQGHHQDKTIRLIHSKRSAKAEAVIAVAAPAGNQTVSVKIKPGAFFKGERLPQQRKAGVV